MKCPKAKVLLFKMMKFSVIREEILPPLQQIIGVIEKRQTMPILANVLLIIEQNQLILTGTDLEIQLIVKITFDDIIVPGSVTVPAKKFLDICRLLPNNSIIKFEQEADKVKISSNRSRFSLNSLPADNYPEFSETELDNYFFIRAGQLKRALDKTLFCMANQDVRYYLNGILLSIVNNKLKLVASDGHRLSVFEDDLENTIEFETEIILPRKGVLELNKLLNNPDTELTVEFSENNVRLSLNNVIFSAKLIDAKYPDFSKVLQKDFLPAIHIQKQLLKNALTRVSVLSNEKFKGVTFDFNKDSLKISAHNPEHDEAEDEIVIDYAGEPLTIAFNAQYLSEAISNLDSELAVLNIAQDISTCLICETEESPYKFVVMPMRL